MACPLGLPPAPALARVALERSRRIAGWRKSRSGPSPSWHSWSGSRSLRRRHRRQPRPRGLRTNLLAPHVGSLYPGATVAGYALTVHVVEVDAIPADRDAWYRGEIAAVDSQQEGDVMVVSSSSGSYWGELLATASRLRGARGIVGDCYARDIATLVEMRYPTFVAGALAYDSLGRIDVADVGLPIQCAGVTVQSGDMVIGDDDGVAIIPRGAPRTSSASPRRRSAGEKARARAFGGGHAGRRGIPYLRRPLRSRCCSRSTTCAISTPPARAQRAGPGAAARSALRAPPDAARGARPPRADADGRALHAGLAGLAGLVVGVRRAGDQRGAGGHRRVVGRGRLAGASRARAAARDAGANLLDDEWEMPLFMAWWDLVGQTLGKPLHELWAELFDVGFAPPRGCRWPPTPGSASRMPRATMRSRSRAGRSSRRSRSPRASRTLKLSMTSYEPDDHVELVARIREAIPPEIDIRIDAHGSWNDVEARRIMRALEPYRVSYIEQPLASLLPQRFYTGGLPEPRRLPARVLLPQARGAAP